MALTADQLSEHLVRNGLVSPDQVQAARSGSGLLDSGASGESLARRLVKEGRLTLFQAQLALGGKAGQLTIGSYLLLEKLGQGGMGQVFKARHRTMKREVAVKVISPSVLKDEASRRRFQREVEAAGQLSHPNIVTAHDAGEVSGTHYLVMEYIPGRDLSVVVKGGGPLTVARAVECVRQAAQGLAYAHGRGIIHRDIKPANLLQDESGAIKILDMGLARFEEAGQDHASVAGLTGTGVLMGTIDYMAPEQAMDSRTADARADIYSLGCTLFFLITGRPIYEDDTIVKRLMAHQAAAIPVLAPDDSDLQHMFSQMVAKKADQRYQSASHVVADLQDWLNRRRSDESVSEAGRTATSAGRTVAGSADPGVCGLRPLGEPGENSSRVISPAAERVPDDTSPSQSSAARTAGAGRVLPASRKGKPPDRSVIGESSLADSDRHPKSSAKDRTSETSRGGSRSESTADFRLEHPVASVMPPRRGGPRLPNRSRPITTVAQGTSGTGWSRSLPVAAAAVIAILAAVAGVVMFQSNGTDDGKVDPQQTPTVVANAASQQSAGSVEKVSQESPPPSADDQASPAASQLAANATDINSVGQMLTTDGSVPATTAVPSAGLAAATPAASAATGSPVTPESPEPFVPPATVHPKVATLKPSPGIVPLPIPPAVSLKMRSLTPISSRALVGAPPTIKELASWSIETARHAGHASGAAFSPDGTMVATAGAEDATIRLWRIDPERGAIPERVILGESSGSWDLEWSRSGKLIAVADNVSQLVSIYDVESGRRVTSIDVNPNYPATIRWSPDDRFLLVPGHMRVGIIDVATGTYTLSEAEFRGVSGVWSPDGLEIVTLGASGQVTFWNATTLKVISQANDPTMLQCKAIDWSPDGRWIVMGGLGGRMTLWDASLRRKVRDIVRPEGGDFESVAWEPIPADGVTADFDWPRLLVGDGQIWDSEVQEKRVGVSLNSPGYECRWSPDGRRVLFSVADGPRVFDARTGILAAECSLPSPVDFRSHYQISTDGKTLRTLQKDDLQIHNAETGEFLRRVSRMPFGKLEASPKDDWIAIYDPAGESGQLTLVDTATYEKRTLLTGHSGKISAARWSGDGGSLASAGHDGTVRIWKASDATQVHELQHGVPVSNVTWDGTGKLIASCSVDRVIRIWSAESGKLQQQYPALEFSPGEGRDGLAWSPSAEMVAIASYSGQALLLDLKSGKLSDPLFSFGVAMTDVVWSNDGRKLTGASVGRIGYRQLSAKSGLTATGHGSPVCWLADNRRLVTGQSAWTPIQAVDTLKMTRLGLLFPRIGIDGWLCIGADGHYHGSEGIESHIVYVALHKDGSQSTHTPADFQQKFAWVNDPAKASLLKLRDRKSAVD